MISRCPRGLLLLVVLHGASPLAQVPEPPPPAEPAALASPAPPVDVAPVTGSANERLIAERLALSRFDVETLWLDTADGPFLALHRPADEAVPLGGLVIVATPGSIVDNVPVPRALLSVAAAGGWSVLSLQPAALAAFAGNLPPAVVGFVGVGAWEADLTGIDVAILDLAGTRDARAMRWQEQRRAAAREYPNSLEAAAIEGAGPDFYGYQEDTARRIRGWLTRAAPSRVVTR